MSKKMYILVNEDIKIGKAKLSGQVGHAVSTYIYRRYIRDYDGNKIELDDFALGEIDEYMESQKKIILKCSQEKLEELESQGYMT